MVTARLMGGDVDVSRLRPRWLNDGLPFPK